MNIISFNSVLMLLIAIICFSGVSTLIFITDNYSVTDEELEKDVYRNLGGVK